MNATLTIASSASAGARSVIAGTANNPLTSGVTPLTFTVTSFTPATAPTVTGMSPAAGMLGNALVATLTGTGFTRDSAVAVADQTIPVLQTSYVSATQLSVVLGLGGTVGAHTLVVASGASSTALKSAPVTLNITMPPVPTTSAIMPASGALGSTTTVTVQGANFTPDMVAEVSGTGITVGNMLQAGPTFVRRRTRRWVCGM